MKKFLPLAFLDPFNGLRAVLDSRGAVRDELLGCQRVGSGQVQCSIKSTYTGKRPHVLRRHLLRP
ncbi:hypothetical protein D3875_20915 [Deinococcus cavernae]|uniref:Uncharacterized protein n=1 Tax=Deinococcus cavernae TaxID=2320857 RepID=A0A418V0U1_9DEIO|nr:hypothetical protein [Deinococcus cavernae]RJF69453.1 hypothetical protein D3875_20915 [Deinococcus cavernae]